MIRTARFLDEYIRHPRADLSVAESVIQDGVTEIQATTYRPRGARPHPGWVVLHGITVPGRGHPLLQRFARSLAASGAVVLLPEVQPWKDLLVEPEAADRVLTAAVRHLSSTPGVAPGGVGIVGFSFGATQALATVARRDLSDNVRVLVAFGGYCDPFKTFHFGFTGEDEWQGKKRHIDPDPYGGWIVASNYLQDVPGCKNFDGIVKGARHLATDAGMRRVYAGDPSYDLVKSRLRGELSQEEREIWDVIAPISGRRASQGEAAWLAHELASAALRRHPYLDPRDLLREVRTRVILAHGYYDRLIPHTETLRLREHLTGTRASLTISKLYAHSDAAPALYWPRFTVEASRYVLLLNRALRAR